MGSRAYRGQSMTSYEFRYANRAGGAVRTTIMQCEADEEAILRARETMKDIYASVEIFDGDRPVVAKRED